MTDYRRTWWKTIIGLLLTAMMLFPVYWMVNVSLTGSSAIRDGALYPKGITLQHYGTVFSQQLPFLVTSVVIGLGTVAVTLLISAPAAYGLSRLFRRRSRTMTFLLIVAQMIPAVVVALGFYQVYTDLGILDTVPGLIIADSTLAVPFGVMLLSSFMAGIPRELLQAAQMDGASIWRTFTSVVLPLSRNSAVTVALFAFLWAWSDFVFASTLDGGGTLRPITLGIYHYIGNNNQEWNAIMATAVVASVPATVLLILAQRYVAAGVTVGAVKD